MKLPSQPSWQAHRGKDMPRAARLSKQEIFSSLTPATWCGHEPSMKTGRLHVVGPPLHGAVYFHDFHSALYVQQAFGGYTAGSRKQMQKRLTWKITPAIMPPKPLACVVCGVGSDSLAEVPGLFHPAR